MGASSWVGVGVKGMLGAALAGALAMGCARNPVTGNPQLSLISETQEVRLGAEAAREIESSIGVVDDAGLQAYVQRVGARLASESERPDLPWSFKVLDDPTPNAFALPGGYIYVTRGMLSLMDSEAELAAVLGHEIGHVTARHAVEQISRQQVAQVGLGLGSILFPEVRAVGGLLGTGLQLLFLEHSRDDEREADQLGFTYALAEGYDVREMDDVFVSLQRVQAQQGGSPLPTWASTHPGLDERIASLQAREQQLQGPVSSLRTGREEFLAQIDGLPYGENPRNGFFADGVFYHPDLAFQFAIPSGWRAQNLAQQVVAVAPREDAAMQLLLAQGSPQAVAQQFLGQRGVRAGERRSQTINGLPAVVSTFSASTQQGTLQGIAAFIQHGGHTYALIGYAPSRRIGAYDDTIASTIGSFRRVTNRSVLAVQPDRIDVVTMNQPMTLAQIGRRYNLGVDLGELALLNQVSSASARIPAGRPVKMVVSGRAPVLSLAD